MKLRLKILFIFLILLAAETTAQDRFVIGEFSLSTILDGDTFRLEGLDRPARLVGIDTEETFKKSDAEERTKEISSIWNEYYSHKKDSSQKPAKIESPFGYKTWQWTKEIFSNTKKVRLESDGAGREKDLYDRYLVYVIAIRNDGTEFNYNVECVKNGYSPYFSKYGYSERFHESFVNAQLFAQSNKLGIWSGKEQCYPDYTERIEWWNKRAEQIVHFEKNFAGKPGFYSMLGMNDYSGLKESIGDTVTVFGDITRTAADKEPHLVILEAGKEETLDLVFFEPHYGIITALELNNPKDYYIYARGQLGEFNGRLQIIIENKVQIWRE